MSQRKQTARKTTGNHSAITSALSWTATSKSRSRIVKRQAVTNGTGCRSKPSLTGSTLLTAQNATAAPSSVPLAPVYPISPVSDGTGDGEASSMSPGPLIRRRLPANALDVPISVCTRFATWLENQTYVQGDGLLHAVKRDGSHFLSLARATVSFHNALRGNSPPADAGAACPLHEHARTLRAFAEVLKVKISEDTLGKDLEAAVLRDGETLMQLAWSCLEFDRAVRGLDKGAG